MLFFKNNSVPTPNTLFSSWVAVTWSPESSQHLTKQLQWQLPPNDISTNIRPWTDEYSNVLSVMSLKDFW
jgi:hypothetical protein